jgi:hypothetical protein
MKELRRELGFQRHGCKLQQPTTKYNGEVASIIDTPSTYFFILSNQKNESDGFCGSNPASWHHARVCCSSNAPR